MLLTPRPKCENQAKELENRVVILEISKGIGKFKLRKGRSYTHLKYITLISHFDISSPAERGVEPLDSLPVERGMKERNIRYSFLSLMTFGKLLAQMIWRSRIR
jgi:hypothetical protein